MSRAAFIPLLDVLLVLLIILPHQPETSAHQDETIKQSLLVVEVLWPDEYKTDIDLWVKTPGDDPVGYSRLRGEHVSLLRDVLGNRKAEPGQEVARGWALPDGEYIVNVHLYTDTGGHSPIPVTVTVWTRASMSEPFTFFRRRTVDLSIIGAETTILRWKMKDGEPVVGSVHYTPESLRTQDGP